MKFFQLVVPFWALVFFPISALSHDLSEGASGQILGLFKTNCADVLKKYSGKTSREVFSELTPEKVCKEKICKEKICTDAELAAKTFFGRNKYEECLKEAIKKADKFFKDCVGPAQKFNSAEVAAIIKTATDAAATAKNAFSFLKELPLQFNAEIMAAKEEPKTAGIIANINAASDKFIALLAQYINTIETAVRTSTEAADRLSNANPEANKAKIESLNYKETALKVKKELDTINIAAKGHAIAVGTHLSIATIKDNLNLLNDLKIAANDKYNEKGHLLMFQNLFGAAKDLANKVATAKSILATLSNVYQAANYKASAVQFKLTADIIDTLESLFKRYKGETSEKEVKQTLDDLVHIDKTIAELNIELKGNEIKLKQGNKDVKEHLSLVNPKKDDSKDTEYFATIFTDIATDKVGDIMYAHTGLGQQWWRLSELDIPLTEGPVFDELRKKGISNIKTLREFLVRYFSETRLKENNEINLPEVTVKTFLDHWVSKQNKFIFKGVLNTGLTDASPRYDIYLSCQKYEGEVTTGNSVPAVWSAHGQIYYIKASDYEKTMKDNACRNGTLQGKSTSSWGYLTQKFPVKYMTIESEIGFWPK